MTFKSARCHNFACGLFALAGMISTGLAPTFAEEGLFGKLSGYWAGSGTVSMNNGSSDKIRCKATYAVGGGGNALEQNLSCASDSYKLQINASVISNGGTITGTWREATRNVMGNLSGTASATDVRANVAGVGFTASLNLSTKGDRQSVSIRPQGATEITAVNIALRKQ